MSACRTTGSALEEICADNYNDFQFNLKGNRRSEKWQIYLYGDKSMVFKRQGVEVLSRGVPLPGIGDVGFDSSHNLDTKHTPLECDFFSCGQRDLFSAFASSASLIDFVTSEIVFQPSFQTLALAALPFFSRIRLCTKKGSYPAGKSH